MQKGGPEQRCAERETRLILLVDGTVPDAFSTSILLQRLEYHIFTAKTAEDALEILPLYAPAVIVTAIDLPGMNGVELLKRLKGDAGTRPIPVIVHTRERAAEYREICRREGCADYLTKPAEPNALYAAIQSATEPAPRRVIRLRTCLAVIVEDVDAAVRPENEEGVTYLSENGMFIATARPQPAGTELPVVFSLKNITIRVEAIVLYSFPPERRPLGGHGMGVRFLHIAEEDKRLIRSYIIEQLTQKPAAGPL